MNQEAHEADNEAGEAREAHNGAGGAGGADGVRTAHEADDQRDFEELVRELMTDDAYTIRPSPAPYPAIRRQGVSERRRRVAAIGAALAAVVAVPAGAYAVVGGNGGGGADTATPMSSVSATASTSGSTTTSGPQPPASEKQLFDGITFAQASDALQQCLDQEHVGSAVGADLAKADSYRIILAVKSTGVFNAPGDGIRVVGVAERPEGFRVVCNVRKGGTAGISTSSKDAYGTGAGPIVPDANAGDLYQQSSIDKGKWKLPFRWGVIGMVDPSVAKVTVDYGDGSATAALDHGWFVASGVLNQQVTKTPHIKGFDAAGKLVYDSDTDKTYDKTLP
ncbi:hypothetical protein ABTX62_32735 [Streptomyces sp. NPDC096046]|uniref:hypothetical protein n=1 Tax=Streptomyces sp. NPDC096046 TaxID=3155542 RepID=UPI003328C147